MLLKMIKLGLVMIAVVIGGVSNAFADSIKTWPEVQPLSTRYHVSEKNPDIFIGLYSSKGKVLYWFSCHAGDFEDEEGYEYYGLYQCRLRPAEKGEDYSPDILVSDTEWNSRAPRASFNIDADGSCSTHRYYGKKRVFMARGMQVVLEMGDVSFWPSLEKTLSSGQSIERFKFDFTISIKADSNATTEIAESVPTFCSVTYSLGKNGKVRSVIQKGRNKEPKVGIRGLDLK